LVIYNIDGFIWNNCRYIDIGFGEATVNCVLDSGAEATILHEKVYDSLVTSGMEALSLPVQNVLLVNAFGQKTKRIRKQVFLEFRMGEDIFEQVFLIFPQLGSDVILGSDFCVQNKIVIDFHDRCIRYERDGRSRRVTSVSFRLRMLNSTATCPTITAEQLVAKET
jgi:hypothetical protein